MMPRGKAENGERNTEWALVTLMSRREKRAAKGQQNQCAIKKTSKSDGPALTIQSGSTAKMDVYMPGKTQKERSAIPLTSVTNLRLCRQNRQGRYAELATTCKYTACGADLTLSKTQ